MSLYLGNLSVEDIEKRTGVSFSDEIRDFMKETRQEKATDIQEGKWHCFDMPFILVCGGRDLAQKIYDDVKEKSSDFKEQMQIGLA